MKGIICFNKPKGMSSAGAVGLIRRVLGTRAVGHMGTLDPMAQGVLLVGIGKATRLFDFFLKKDKEYIAEYTFGAHTDTLDAEGQVLESTDYIPDWEKIRSVLDDFRGEIDQMPPAYSAKSIGGVRAYKLARQGKEVNLTPAKVHIYDIEATKKEGNTVTFRISCSAGTYIRSLARDIAAATGSLAYMSALTRVKCGKYVLSDAIDEENLKKLGTDAIIPLEKVLDGFAEYRLSDDKYSQLKNGIKLPADGCPDGQFALYCGGELFGIAENIDGIIKVKSYLLD